LWITLCISTGKVGRAASIGAFDSTSDARLHRVGWGKIEAALRPTGVAYEPLAAERYYVCAILRKTAHSVPGKKLLVACIGPAGWGPADAALHANLPSLNVQSAER
jgi:hypothetical protein